MNVNFPIAINFIFGVAFSQSRSDGTLLTVDFSLRRRTRTQEECTPCEVPQEGYSISGIVSSLRDLFHLCLRLHIHIHNNRKLKLTVNKVSSLRDWLNFCQSRSDGTLLTVDFNLRRRRGRRRILSAPIPFIELQSHFFNK